MPPVTLVTVLASLFERAASRRVCCRKRVVSSRALTSVVDELDALANARGGVKSNNNRKQTLHQLLAEVHLTNLP